MHWTVSYYNVTYGCGHQRTVTRGDLDREQLFVGKRAKCSECAVSQDGPPE
jgi:hypothetical protein